MYMYRDFPQEILFAGEDIWKQITRSKVELKNTGLGQNKKYFGGEDDPIFFWGGKINFWGEENPSFPGKLALG